DRGCRVAGRAAARDAPARPLRRHEEGSPVKRPAFALRRARRLDPAVTDSPAAVKQLGKATPAPGSKTELPVVGATGFEPATARPPAG
ncbi:MAG: hypothetical protein LC808_42770, partial [Actinobacteria bacterium]|nr:hypothetical protein [Actinomycetota bacterium]